MGFCPNRSTIDNVFIIIQIFEKCFEHNIDQHNIFFDFTQAFDSVCKNKIECLAQYKIPAKLVRLIELTLFNNRARGKINKEYTEEFKVESGVKQGRSFICNFI